MKYQRKYKSWTSQETLHKRLVADEDCSDSTGNGTVAMIKRHRRIYRDRLRGAVGPHHSEAEWRSLLIQAEGRCAHCGTSNGISRDHIIPLSRGGSDAIENIQPLCISCNSRKGASIPRSPRAQKADECRTSDDTIGVAADSSTAMGRHAIEPLPLNDGQAL